MLHYIGVKSYMLGNYFKKAAAHFSQTRIWPKKLYEVYDSLSTFATRPSKN